MSSKVFIVTGASRGLGLAIAQTLLQDSHKVFLVARTEKDLKALKEQHPSSVDFIAADLADLTVRGRLILFTSIYRLDYMVTSIWKIGGISLTKPDCA